MAEESRPWPGTTLGDAGPYSAEDWHYVWGFLFGSQTVPYNNRGVIRNILNELEVTAAPPNAVNVDTGVGLVYGKFYRNTAVVNVAVPSSSGPGNWREDLICLRADWALQTIRIARHANPGENVPGTGLATQASGATWEIPLAAVRIDDVGAITLITDLRDYVSDLMQPKQLQAQAEPDVSSGASHEVKFQRAVVELIATEFCAFSFVVPSDFISLLTATIYLITNAAGTFNWRLDMEAAQCGELADTVTDDKANADEVVGVGSTLLCLDASTALDGIVAGHHVGLRFTLNALGTCGAVNVATLLIEYR